MIVTYITELSTFEGEEKQICLSYHDHDQLHNPLDEIQSRFSKKTKYFYFHVNDIFKDYDPSQEVEPGWGDERFGYADLRPIEYRGIFVGLILRACVGKRLIVAG